MALLTKREFAELCLLKTKDLSNYIKRGNVIVDGDLIDDRNERNRLFLEKRRGKMDEALVDPVIVENKPSATQRLRDIMDVGRPAADSSGIPDLLVSDRRYKHFLALKTERAAELDRLKIEKAKGVVVPSEPIIPIFLQHNQHILQEQRNADEEMLTAFAHKYSIPPADVAYIRGEWVKRRNAAVQNATNATQKAIPAIINNYSDRRGVGERD